MLTVPPNENENENDRAYMIDLFSGKFSKNKKNGEEEVPDAEMQEEDDDDYDSATAADDDDDNVSDADYGSDCSVSSDDTTDEREYRVVTDFINQLQENRFTDFGWPPPPECPTYKYGMTVPYLGEFDFETETGEKYDTAKKFLKQVRTSWGYDVDCTPPAWLNSPFFPINLKSKFHEKRYGQDLKEFPKYALEKINDQAEVVLEKRFELVRVEKAVTTRTMLFLLTLTIRETDDSGAEKAIRVAVGEPPGWGLTLVECKLIPPLSSSSSSSSSSTTSS